MCKQKVKNNKLSQFTEHKPLAANEVHVMLFEPANPLNTGDKMSELTVETPEYL